ncbi:MAG: zinc ribbon domain-containing protein [Thermoplasmata archaeon]|nr:zinc ribbon domain-containing protein [Candidatus Sysuiplasma acidicola]MBX8646474.1 zinc ribbon domain-containing protein [Candidatus Sysuiplasma acidicola]MDH2904866.1 zinc ribbon domain-containing protein [Methanomassiliicoccales archaeon]
MKNVGLFARPAVVSQFVATARKLVVATRLRLLGPKIVGPSPKTCYTCLGLMSSCQDPFFCECGASYHRGCYVAGETCLRCGKAGDAKHVITAAAWVPKFAEFAQIQGSPVATDFRCMNCEHSLPPEDTFCTSCGYHLESLHGYLCPVCGTAVAEEDRFCRCCAAVFGEQNTALIRCDACGNFERAGMLACRCGMPLAPSCPECGSEIDEKMYCGFCRMYLDTA